MIIKILCIFSLLISGCAISQSGGPRYTWGYRDEEKAYFKTVRFEFEDHQRNFGSGLLKTDERSFAGLNSDKPVDADIIKVELPECTLKVPIHKYRWNLLYGLFLSPVYIEECPAIIHVIDYKTGQRKSYHSIADQAVIVGVIPILMGPLGGGSAYRRKSDQIRAAVQIHLLQEGLIVPRGELI